MPWFNVDDGFANAKPVLRIPRRYRCVAIGLWTLAGSWSAKELTDGFIPDHAIEEFASTDQIAQWLVRAGLWRRVEGGWQFENWSKYQKTKEQVYAYRAAEAERKRKARSKPKPPDSEGVSGVDSVRTECGVPGGIQAESALPLPEPLPEPLPSTSLTLVEGGPGGDPPNLPVAAKAAPADARGRKLPKNWCPSEETIAAMRDQFPHLDLKAIHVEFSDYWCAVPGVRGRKTDWDATWRNRVREIASRQRPNGHAVNGVGKPTQKAMGAHESAERVIAAMKGQS